MQFKMDSKEESRTTFGNTHDSGKSGLPFHDRELHELISPGAMAGNRSRWPAAEPLHGRRGSRRDDSIDEDRTRNFKGTASWNADESYGTAMSPGLDDWRHQREQRSPRNEPKRSKRSRSQSRSRSRSRSRSPIRDFGRDLGPNDRNRSRSGASAQVCKDYASGWCRRGTHCHFLHSQANEDSWQRQQKYPVPPNDSRGRNNDRRHGDPPLEGHSNREPRRATAIPCKFLAAGHCRNGKNCRFSHEGQTYPSPDKSRDARVSVDDSKVASEQEEWVGDMDMSPDWNYGVQTSKPVDEPAPIITNFSQNLIEPTTVQIHGAAVAVPSETPGSNALPLTGSNAVSQGQIQFPSSGVIVNTQIQPMVQEEKGIKRPDIVEPTASQFNSGVAITPTNVSSEQLTTISASIAQLLANGQPLQQIYGSLVQNMMETSTFNNVGLLTKDSTEITGAQKMYDPTSDSIEVEKHEVSNPPGFSQTPSMEKKTADEKPEVAAPATESRDNKNDNKEEHLEPGSVGSKENNGAPTKKSTKLEEPRDVKENGPLEKIDGEEKAEDGKKGKEAKGAKAFKFALVEFVKELLKPAWKEGQMSKDAYKNIVKKAVEKVTGTMQGANVPHTQDKIQQYLSASKPKLIKLVQAYVEKFQKDK